MPYCVHCGVELNAAAKACPLCHTPVVDPSRLQPPETSPFFPTKPAVVAPVSRKEAALLFSVMLASAAIACAVLNLFLKPGVGWSLYVVAAAVTLWIWFVLPLLVRGMPMFLRLTIDVMAIGIYVYLVAVDLNGFDWFYGLALPIILLAGAILFVLGFFLSAKHISILSTTALSIGAVGLFCAGVEYDIDRYLQGEWVPGWSLIVLIICAALIVPLRVIRRTPALREEARRRFHF